MRAIIASAAALAAISTTMAQEVHYAPEERLDAIDAALIGGSKQSIDLASYTLTDWKVLNALNAAGSRGVVIRIVLDPRERQDFVKLADLSDDVRIKRGGPFMHLKAYAIDGAGSCEPAQRISVRAAKRPGQRSRRDPGHRGCNEVRGAL